MARTFLASPLTIRKGVRNHKQTQTAAAASNTTNSNNNHGRRRSSTSSCASDASSKAADLAHQLNQARRILKTNQNRLLHACVRRHWKLIVETCAMYASVVVEMAAIGHRDGSNDLLPLMRKQLRHVDPWGNTALHIALYEKPPLSVVRAILDLELLLQDAAPTATTSPSAGNNKDDAPHALLICNSRGQTPLHVACANGCSTAVLQVLVDANTYSHVATQAMFLPDHTGYTILDVLLHHYEMWLHVPTVREYNPKVEHFTAERMLVDATVVDGHAPTDDPDQQDISHSSTIDDYDGTYYCDGDDDDDVAGLYLRFWNSIDLLLQAAWWSSPLEDHHDRQHHEHHHAQRSSLPSLLHAAAYCSTIIPSKVADALFRVVQMEEKRYTPLDVMVSTPMPQSTSHDHILLQNRRYFMEECARRYNLDKDDNDATASSLLHQAMASGYLWNEHPLTEQIQTEQIQTEQQQDTNAPFRYRSPSALSILWQHVSGKAAPFAMHDARTGLYPFQLAAIASDFAVHNDVNALDTIYQLLRLNPHAVSDQL